MEGRGCFRPQQRVTTRPVRGKARDWILRQGQQPPTPCDATKIFRPGPGFLGLLPEPVPLAFLLGGASQAPQRGWSRMNPNSKNRWPWILSGLLAAALTALAARHLHQTRLHREATIRQEEFHRLQVELETLRLENEKLRAAAAASGGESPAETTRELLRLRSEVTQLRKQLAELEALRAANAELLQALQNTPQLSPTQMARVVEARRKGAILGVVIQPAPAGQSGVLIAGLDPQSPAATSGLQPGDLIYALDGRPIPNAGVLQAEMLTRTPGETVVVDVLRSNTPLRFQVRTRPFPATP